MNDNDTRTDGRTAARMEPRETDERSTSRLSRRDFLRAGAAAGAGSLALGMSETVAAAKVQEKCNTDYGKIDVSQAFTLIDNR